MDKRPIIDQNEHDQRRENSKTAPPRLKKEQHRDGSRNKRPRHHWSEPCPQVRIIQSERAPNNKKEYNDPEHNQPDPSDGSPPPSGSDILLLCFVSFHAHRVPCNATRRRK